MWARIKFNDYSDNEYIQASCYIEANSLHDAVNEFLSNYLDVKKRDIISVIEEEPASVRNARRAMELDEANRKLRQAAKEKKLEERRLFLKSLSTKELAAFLKREEDEESRKEFAREGGYL